MRKVKCKICKSEGNTDIFYKVVNEKGKNEYYCNEKEYQEYIRNKEERDKLYKYIAIEIMNYQQGQILQPLLIKMINDLNKFYSYEVIYETFLACENPLSYWMNLEGKFKTDVQRITYMIAIIKNRINDIYKNYQKIQELNESERKLLNYIKISILNYNEKQTIQPTLIKKIRELKLFYPYEVIEKTFRKYEQSFNKWMLKEGKFSSELSKINYMMVVIQNNINDIYNEYKLMQKKTEEELKVQKNIEVEILNNENNKANIDIVDISNFLD